MQKYTTAQRLNQIANKRNLKQIDIIRLAEPYCRIYKVKIGRNDLSQYFSGKVEPRQNKLFILAKALDVSEAWLMGFDVPEEREHTALPTKTTLTAHQIPILGHIAAGLPLYAAEHIEGYTYTERNGGAEYFALRIRGDSMTAAGIKDGDIITVRRQNTVENGDIAVVLVNNETATVKRFRKDGSTVQLIPQSFNPEHQIQFYDLKETQIEIIGKVVESKTEF